MKTELTPDQLRIAVLETMGWKQVRIATDKKSGDQWPVYQRGEEIASLYTNTLPELTHDYLAGCRKTLTPGERVDYVEHLRNIVGPHGSATIWDYIDASEEQQALAFLHAKGITL